MEKKRFLIREIRPEEAEEAIRIEQICFPPNEACLPEQISKRAQTASELFLVAEDMQNGKLAGFLNGLATDEETFRDDFFLDAGLYQASGRNVMLLGLDVLPEYRRQGLATEIMKTYLEREKRKGRKKLILTCLEEKVTMYEKMGYIDLGIADSSWGGEEWHEMYYTMNE